VAPVNPLKKTIRQELYFSEGRRTHDLGRIDHALADEIAVLAGLRVEAPVVLVLLEDLNLDDRSFCVATGQLHRDVFGDGPVYDNEYLDSEFG
jgi:hypothetical protein